MYSIGWQRLVLFITLFAMLPAPSPDAGFFAGCDSDISVSSTGDSGPGTLRQALVDICSGGTITLEVSPITLTSGEIVIGQDVTILGQGAKSTVVQAGATPMSGNNRIFTVSEGVTVTLGEMTIRHGNPGGSEPGGAVQILTGANVTIEDAAIVTNRAGRDGGAIRLQSASLTINNSEISENSANKLGAITYGGGIEIVTDSGNAMLAVNNSTIADNFVGNGGGISAWASSGSTVNLTLTHCTIADNSIESAGAGSGLYTFVDTAATLHLDVANCILANGTLGGNFHADGNGTVTIGRVYTLLQDSTLPDGGSDGNIDNAEPLLGALQDNGGQTQTLAPFASSPAVDAGDPAFSAPPDYDQRGSGFPRVLNGRLDIGAHESFLPLFLPVVVAP
jgi:hypothetical protein